MESTQKSFSLAIVDEESSVLTDALGITQERAEELFVKVRKAFMVSDKITKAAALVTPDCRHENELLFCYHAIAKLQSDLNNPLSVLEKMFGENK